MRVNQLFVDPIASLFREFRLVDLTRGQHHLPLFARDDIAVHVNVSKIVVGPDSLNLRERVFQGVPIPQPNVVQRGPVGLQIKSFSRSFSVEIALLDAIDAEGAARPGNVLFDIWSLATDFIRLDDEVGYVGGNDDAPNNVNDQRNGDHDNKETDATNCQGINQTDNRADDERNRDPQETRKKVIRFRISDSGESLMIVPKIRITREQNTPGQNQQKRGQRARHGANARLFGITHARRRGQAF